MLSKIEVSPGVFWIEVPEARLNLLCGCPADSVKHLVKRGLIASKENQGYLFETGPNAILLSDILVQNGAFSNLAEFPVLQMLYSQGMVLPGHPNNTGQKPLLLGSRAQVSAQIRYIYRGTYGLTTLEELTQSGVDPETARELIRMKLSFAFGTIRAVDELLDTVIVETEPVEIRGGVFIQRLRMNVFEIRHNGQSVVVDLNLPPSVSYGAPYFLGFHNIKREYFQIIHSGEGDGWDARRPCMSSIMIFQGRVYLIDAGPNLLYSLRALGIGVNEIEGIFHTHAHDDHFCGLPALMRSDHRIKYFATRLVRTSVAKKLSALVSIDEEDFPNYFDVLDLLPETWNEIGGLEVKPAFSPHPVETNVYLFRTMWREGHKTYAHYADIASFEILKKMVTGGSLPGISIEMYNAVARTYLEPVDIKKIDIGGGLIHGNAYDFRRDSSRKIILSHTSRDLTVQEKEIGSGASFGTTEVLIASFQDYVRMYAFNYLEAYFPRVPRDDLRQLANNPVTTFNPHSILLKSGTVCDSIYLIISGEVEMLDTEAGISNVLSSGTVIGEMSALMGLPLRETYVSASFLQALEIPAGLYRHFTEKHKIFDDLARVHEKRDFLQRTWLFGECISSRVLNKVVRAITEKEQLAGSWIEVQAAPDLFVLHKGKARLWLDENAIESLHPGDFFAERCVLFKIPCLYRIEALTDCLIFRLPASLLLEIPVVRWKLFETYNRRSELLINPQLALASIFQWRDDYRTNVAVCDEAHKQLFGHANELYQKVVSGHGFAVESAFAFMTDYMEQHFRAEEGLMEEHAYPLLASHKTQHEAFRRQIDDLQSQSSGCTEINLVNFLRDWIVRHILTADKQYGQFFNERGVF